MFERFTIPLFKKGGLKYWREDTNLTCFIFWRASFLHKEFCKHFFSCLDFRFISMCKSVKLALCCLNRHGYFYFGEIIDHHCPLMRQYETIYIHFPWHLKNNRSSKFLNQIFSKCKTIFYGNVFKSLNTLKTQKYV